MKGIILAGAVALTTLHSAPTLLPTMETAIQIHAEAGE